MFLGCSPCCGGGGCQTHQEKFGLSSVDYLFVSWGIRHVVYAHEIGGIQFPTYNTNESSPSPLRFDNQSSFSTGAFTYQISAAIGDSLRIQFAAYPNTQYFVETLGFNTTPITGIRCNFTEFPCYSYPEIYPTLGARADTVNSLLVEIRQPNSYVRSTTNIIRGRLGVHGGTTYTPPWQFPDASRVFFAIGGGYNADPSAAGFPGSFPWDLRFTMQNIDQDQPARFSNIESLWQIVIYDVQAADGTSVGLYHTQPGTITPNLLAQS